ncbi:hypothetical protein K504DRAFT_449482 [Pleomassaria siparia CBS 279.74]|uniref:Uncharacterized protein n=1 Tax=Pleomassaria siparia CBS 279.74 TaxID=1314801 RepID=A0A6G1JV38_9PLEO|nr:hypothetical protein K504DRAFT_449482 [Pleomassaria siparia CBS 279.74]
MDYKEKSFNNHSQPDRRPRSNDYPEVYYPPVALEIPQSSHTLNKEYGSSIAPFSPVSQLSNSAPYYPPTNFRNPPPPISPPPIYRLQERPPRRRRAYRICIWLLVVLVVVFATTGGVIGGIYGAKALQSKTSNNDAGQAKAPSTNSSTSSDSQTEPSVATPKFASIASAKCFNETFLQVYYLESTTLKASMFDGASWSDLGDLEPSISPRQKSPMAAISWVLDSNVQLRLYYFDAKNREIELAGSCTGGGPPCTWTTATMLQATGISANSSLTAVYWEDPVTGVEVRTTWQNTNGKLAGSVFTRGSWSADIPFVDAMPGTPIAANVDSSSTPFVIRVWYRSPNSDLSRIQYNSTDPGWKSPDPTITVGNTTNLDPYAPIGVGFVPVNASSNTSEYTGLYAIQGDKQPVVVDSTDNGTTYSTSSNMLGAGDDAGGAIAALGWTDPADKGLRSIRVFFSKDGNIQEMAQRGDKWTVGSVLGKS